MGPNNDVHGSDDRSHDANTPHIGFPMKTTRGGKLLSLSREKIFCVSGVFSRQLGLYCLSCGLFSNDFLEKLIRTWTKIGAPFRRTRLHCCSEEEIICLTYAGDISAVLNARTVILGDSPRYVCLIKGSTRRQLLVNLPAAVNEAPLLHASRRKSRTAAWVICIMKSWCLCGYGWLPCPTNININVRLSGAGISYISCPW